MKRLISLFLIAFTLTACQQQKTARPEIDSIFADWDKDNSPGAALGVFKDGQAMYTKGYGMANLEYNIPIDENSVFRIGSTSKQFTAACIVLLSLEGKLAFSDPLSKFYPKLPDYADKITLTHLLNHTSGLRDYLQLAYLKGLAEDDYYTDADIMRWLEVQTSINFEPGSEFLYSNSGYWILGQIVNQVSGKNMAEYAREKIFEPLGMSSTHFHNDHNMIVPNRASGYSPNREEGYSISMTTLDMIGDGGIFTSINDIKKWDDSFFDRKVLSDEFWNLMTENGTLNNGEQIDYAMGLFVEEYNGLKVIRHGGAFVGFRAELLRFPEQHLSVAVFANRADANPESRADAVADVLLADQFPEQDTVAVEEAAIPTPDVIFTFDQLVGKYEIEPGIDVDIAIKNDSLNITQSWNQESDNMVKIEGNTYMAVGNDELKFTFSDLSEGVTQVLSVSAGSDVTVCNRKQPIDLSGVDLNDYTGSYYSTELDVSYDIKNEGGALIVKMGETDPQAMVQVDLEQFSMQGMIFGFERNEDKVSRFKLEAGRAKNLVFTKE